MRWSLIILQCTAQLASPDVWMCSCLCSTLWTCAIMLAILGFWDVYVLVASQSDTPLCKLTSSRCVMMTVGGVCRQAWGRCSRAPGLPADMAHGARSPGQRGGVAGGRQCPRPSQECQQALSATLLAQVLCSHSTTALNNIQCNFCVSDPCD